MADEQPAGGASGADPTAVNPTGIDSPAVNPTAFDPQAIAGAATVDTALDATAPPMGGAFDLPVDTTGALADQSAIDELLKQAHFEDPLSVDGPGGADGNSHDAMSPSINAQRFELPNFGQVMADAQISNIDLLRDVDLTVKIELGRSRMQVEDVLKLGEGSVVELDKLAGDPVDVFVNDRLVARGEVLVLNDNFCVRVNEIVAGAKDEGM